MCGIVGSVNFHLKTHLIDEVLYHRGPDEQNFFKENNIQFYHLRLSILDIEGGKQPMHYKHYTIVFNGEIYNHLELRKKFDLRCKTRSDTETLLQLYNKLGYDCLNEFDGMFAFAICDRKKQKIFLARDRAGKKPLYFYHHKDRFIFASELNVLKTLLPLEINNKYIYEYLRFGFLSGTHTPYHSVYELLGGGFAVYDIDKSNLSTSQWWDIFKYYKHGNTNSFNTAVDNIEEYLHQAVQRRIESSDIEVGSFLSGGIDSGLVTAIASKYKPSIRTFTVSFEGEYDESPLAKMVSKKYQTDHTEIKISFDNLASDVEKIITNYGEPYMDSSAIPSYYVSKEAKRYLTVILNGDGGDELFGGYRRYVPFAKLDFFKSYPFIQNIASVTKHLLPIPHNKKNSYNYLYRLIDFMGKRDVGVYLSATSDIFEGYEKNILSTNFDYLSDVENIFKEINNSELTGLKKIMNLDFNLSLFSDLLVKMDIATMANSLEGRSPFLSKELLEYVPSLNDTYKIKGKTTKYILRKLSEKYLPIDIINQPKRGFEIPLKKWVENDLKDLIFSYLCNSSSYSYHFVKEDFVKKLIEKKIHISDEKRAKILWTLFSLDVWYKNINDRIEK